LGTSGITCHCTKKYLFHAGKCVYDCYNSQYGTISQRTPYTSAYHSR